MWGMCMYVPVCVPEVHFSFPSYSFVCSVSKLSFIYLCVCFFMCVNILLAYVYTMYVSGACRGQTKLSDLLKLELQMVVGCHVGAGNHQNPGPLEEQRVFLTPGWPSCPLTISRLN